MDSVAVDINTLHLQPYRPRKSTAVTYVTWSRIVLGRRLKKCLQTVHVLYDNMSRVHFQKAFSLQAHEIARNELPNRSQLISKLLMGSRELKLDSTGTLRAVALSEFQQR